MTRSFSAVLAALALAAGAAAAHDLFIKMDAYLLPPDTPVRVPIINGTFERSENSITADRVEDVSMVRAGTRASMGLETWSAEGDTTFLEFRTGEPGTYVLGVETRPRDLEMEAADFNEYLAHDGIPDVLVQRALDRELDRGAVERYSKHVKAVFQVGDAPSGGLDVVFGYPAELVPLTNPYAQGFDGEIAVRALVDGQPVADQLVLAGGEAAEGELSSRTDEAGMARFTLGAKGRWWVKFIHMRPSAEEGLDYESKWATITFEVR